MANAQGIHLVINARTDVIMFQDESPQTLHDAIHCGNAYREAGVDCIFVPDVGNLDKKTIPILVKEINAPININAGAMTPTLLELQGMGVARVSRGPRPMRVALSLLRKIAEELITVGTYQLMSESSSRILKSISGLRDGCVFGNDSRRNVERLASARGCCCCGEESGGQGF